jgi:hypothetical protein|tara:strand:- start:98 stop:331 length:234 start_codon:yes stop_codon:yes gene_type:complete
MIKERLQLYTLEDMKKMVGIVTRRNELASGKWKIVPNYDTYVIELTYPALDSDELDDAFIELEFDILGDYYPAEYFD